MSTIADLLQVSTVGPWVAAAAVLLTLAWRVAKAQRESARRQGERIGALERGAGEERVRRQQVEAVLCDLGVPLPFWPPDGPDQPRPRRPAPRRLEDDLEELEEDATYTRERPSVPPLDYAAVARHRRG